MKKGLQIESEPGTEISLEWCTRGRDRGKEREKSLTWSIRPKIDGTFSDILKKLKISLTRALLGLESWGVGGGLSASIWEFKKEERNFLLLLKYCVGGNTNNYSDSLGNQPK